MTRFVCLYLSVCLALVGFAYCRTSGGSQSAHDRVKRQCIPPACQPPPVQRPMVINAHHHIRPTHVVNQGSAWYQYGYHNGLAESQNRVLQGQLSAHNEWQRRYGDWYQNYQQYYNRYGGAGGLGGYGGIGGVPGGYGAYNGPYGKR